MDIPIEWSADVSGESLYDDNGDFLAWSIEASSNLDEFWTTYSTPGVAFRATDVLGTDVGTILDDNASEYGACTYDGRSDYDDGVYIGLYDLYVDCDDVNSAIIELAAVPEDGAFVTYLIIQAVSDADFDAMDTILDTFFVYE